MGFWPFFVLQQIFECELSKHTVVYVCILYSSNVWTRNIRFVCKFVEQIRYTHLELWDDVYE